MRVRRPAPDASIPTSSMADIAFLLIIFFMVTAVFAATKGLDLQLPPKETKDGEPEPAILIHVLPDRLEVDCQPMDPDRLLAYLEPKLTHSPSKPVILYTDPDTPYHRMIEIFDRLASTRAAASPWPFSIEQLSVPTHSDIDAYVATFGVNPMEAACR